MGLTWRSALIATLACLAMLPVPLSVQDWARHHFWPVADDRLQFIFSVGGWAAYAIAGLYVWRWAGLL